jgi:hypothetical protein
MNRYWNPLKIVLACVIVIGTIFWAMNSVRPISYSGADLTFPVGNGAITLTNPSDQPIPVQLVSTGSRTFSVSSTIEGMPSSSTKQETGTTASQLVEFVLPPGVSELTVVRSGNTKPTVNFVANTETKLEAAALPLNTNDTRTTIIIVVVVMLGALFYISRATNHRWIGILRGQPAPAAILKPAVEVASYRQGQTIRAFGDNRTDLSDEPKVQQP